MKKLLVICTLALATMASANAQEAFKHLGVGVEVGTTGAGLELSLPIVSDHLVLKAGYNFPSLTFNVNSTISTSSFNSEISKANMELAKIPGCTERVPGFTDPAAISGTIKGNLNNAKVMLEYYPSAKSSFHIIAGVFIGNDIFASGNLNLSSQFMTEYANVQSSVKTISAKYPQAGTISVPDPMFNMNGKTYSAKSGSAVINAGIAKAKPYFGLGIGRSIPDSRVGFQFELGAWYHGKINLTTTNPSIAYDSSAPEIITSDIQNIVDKLVVYPAMIFRVTVKLF